MKKNLKKAISAVIALAVAGSMIPASFAAKLTLTDVADTASYATAVNTLVALGVINGYEDNTFLPDNLITRAEVTKVVVAALNQTEAAEGMTGSTGFADVADDFWANGFINAGVQIGFINGMEDNKFAPQDNVTYAQIVKMLVASMGYEEYAQYMGGWPNGYLSIANSEGITAGVKASANDNVTRAQVAQLVYNALNTPIVENTGMEYSSAGILVPTIAKMDGKNGNYYKTLLTENFDAYMVEGYVVDTVKTSESLEADQVSFGIAKSEYYDNTEFAYTTTINNPKDEDLAGRTLTPVYVGDTDAADYQGVYATAIIMVDEYDDYVLISFIPSGKNKSVVFDANLLDTAEIENENEIPVASNFTQDYLKFYATESATKSTKYSLQTTGSDEEKTLDVDLYVNGFAVSGTRDNIFKYVISNDVSSVELVDTYKTDGYYDAIYVDYYATAQIDQVSTSSGRIDFVDCTTTSISMTLDEEDEDLVFNIYYNGEKITLAELKEDDILSIAYKVDPEKSEKEAFDNSDHYDIYVSRDIQTGKMTGRDDNDDMTVTIGGVEYKFVEPFVNDEFKGNKMIMSDEYNLYVDAFGRIYKYETNASAAKYAILDKFVYTTSEEAFKATLYTVDGTSKTYYFDDSKANNLIIDGTPKTVKTKKEIEDNILPRVYDDTTDTGRVAVSERVIKYKVSTTSGEITQIEFLEAKTNSNILEESEVVGFDSYKERSKAIGSVKMSDATKIIDAIEYNGTAKVADLSMGALSSLVDDVPYEAYAYGEKYSDGTYPVVVIVTGEGVYNNTTRFAVVTGTASETSDETTGEEIYNLPALYKGEATTLVVSKDEYTGTMPSKGEVIFFQTASNGYIDVIDVIFSFEGIPTYSELLTNSLKPGTDSLENAYVKYPTAGLSDDFSKTWTQNSDDIQLVYGPIMAKEDSYYSIGRIDANKKTNITVDETNDNGCLEIDITGDTKVYSYDYSVTNKDLALSAVSTSAIRACNIAKVNTENDGDIVDWSKILADSAISGVNFAFSLVVDGEAVDVLVFQSK